MYDYHIEQFRKRIKPSLIALIGQLTAIQRHYVSYADLLKIRYSPFECLIIVGTEDRLVRETNSYMIRQVCLSFPLIYKSSLGNYRFLVVDLLKWTMLVMVYKLNVQKK